MRFPAGILYLPAFQHPLSTRPQLMKHPKKDRIFAMAFPTLYPTGQAEFNTSQLQKVDLNDYARHLLCFPDGRFGHHPRWQFFVFNLLMCWRANSSAHIYVLKAFGLKDLSRDE